MWITRNEVSGEITLKPINHDQRRRNLELLLKMIEEYPFTEDFIPEPLPAKSTKAGKNKSKSAKP